MGWDLLVDRTDLATTEVVEQAVPDPGDGEVVLRVDRVGMTANNGEDLPGAPPAFFFAADQPRTRAADWGPGGIEARHTEAWTRFAPVATGWVDVTVGQGSDGLAAAWHDVLAGSTAPRTGHVVALGD